MKLNYIHWIMVYAIFLVHCVHDCIILQLLGCRVSARYYICATIGLALEHNLLEVLPRNVWRNSDTPCIALALRADGRLLNSNNGSCIFGYSFPTMKAEFRNKDMWSPTLALIKGDCYNLMCSNCLSHSNVGKEHHDLFKFALPSASDELHDIYLKGIDVKFKQPGGSIEIRHFDIVFSLCRI